MGEKLYFHTPVGRFVSGSLTEKRTTDNDNRPIEPDKQRYEFGLAIAKTDPQLPTVFQQIAAFAKSEYNQHPAIQQRIDQWFQTMQGFSMKISDGDKPNSQGAVNKNTAGHFVIWYSTAQPIITANAQNVQIDPASIKRGWFVDVASSCAVNGLTNHQAGIYMNPTCVRLIAEGEEIVGGISVEAALQNAPAAPTQLPPGARPIGSAPAAPASSGAPGTGMVGVPQMPGAAPAAPQMPGAAPAAPQMPGAAPAQPEGGAPLPGMIPATPAPAGVSQGAPVGMPQTGAAPAPGGGIASPGNYPQYPQGVALPGTGQ